jgi:hypothetical protein
MSSSMASLVGASRLRCRELFRRVESGKRKEEDRALFAEFEEMKCSERKKTTREC